MSFKQALADSWYRGRAWLYLLAPLAWGFALLSALRRWAYRSGWLEITRLPVSARIWRTAFAKRSEFYIIRPSFKRS